MTINFSSWHIVFVELGVELAFGFSFDSCLILMRGENINAWLSHGVIGIVEESML